MKRTPRPVTVRSGNLEFLKVNSVTWNWRELYHWLLGLSWPRFILCLLVAYLCVNFLFAGLYALVPGGIAEMRPDSFSDAFFFSAETIATVGYGHMYPASVTGHLLATAEMLLGMFSMAVVTGLIFVRFSRPTANLEFSRCLVLSNFDGVPTLMLRVANQRNQPMMEAQFRLMLISTRLNREGEEVAYFYELPLQVARVIMFPAIMTMRHFIDDKSPLYGKSVEEMERNHVRFIASVECTDSVVAAAVQSQQVYTWRDIHFGERFVEIYTEKPNNCWEVDYGRLNETEPANNPAPAS